MYATRILIVDDNQNVLNGYRRNLRALNPLVARSGQEALQLLDEHDDIGVLVTDYHMPHMNGLELIHDVIEIDPFMVPILITGDQSQDAAVEAINATKVFRFLQKPASKDVMVECIEAALIHHRAIKDQSDLDAENRSKLRDLSLAIESQRKVDDISGLPNRIGLREKLETYLCGPILDSTFLVYLDVDLFKLTNDSIGERGGNHLLKVVAQLLQIHVDFEIAARLDGDKFCCLAKNISKEALRAKLAGLRDNLQQHGFFWQGQRRPVSVSIGAIRLNDRKATVETSLMLAEVAMQLARESHSGLLITDSLDTSLVDYYEQIRIAEKVQEALTTDRLELHHQMILPTSNSGNSIHFEVLTRLRDHDGTYISPARFIPIAEKYRLGTTVDRRILEMIGRWIDQSDEKSLQSVEAISINLSAQSVVSSDILNVIHDHLIQSRISPSQLCFEITETASFENFSAVKSFIRDARKLGCKIAIDDFGTGYASFEYLREMTVDYLKIDGIFIRGLAKNALDRAIVNAMIDISKLVPAKTIAEFVENEKTKCHLEQMGVDLMQGFYLHKPQPLLALTELH